MQKIVDEIDLRWMDKLRCINNTVYKSMTFSKESFVIGRVDR